MGIWALNAAPFTMQRLPTGTITFLFTDLEGSTKLWEQYPEPMRVALARHDALLRQAVESFEGYLVKSTGDGTLAAFHTSIDGLSAALMAQQALGREIWPTPLTLQVRMGLHTGTAEAREGDYFGPSVNRAARLMAAAHGGQALLSEAAQELARDSLPPKVGLKNLGEHRLKDLTRPETVYQIVHPDLPEAFPPLRSLENVPNNLPQQLTSFVGREQALGEVSALLRETRLLTLTGSGGSGKTRLSLQVAADALDEYADGVWLVELAPLADAARIPQTIASVLGVKEQPGQPIAQTLMEHLKSRHLLLLLDNCEHLIGTVAQVAAGILRACSRITILASSREPLGIAGERTYRVPSLSLPEAKSAHTATVESLNAYTAVRLFIERARQVKPDFTVTNANAPALAQLCCQLDGIPLAIELAAARARSLSVEEINNRLDSRFRLLTGGDRSALPRQQTLRALVDWSYDLLTENEKTLLMRLSVFVGGWTLAAAEAVCGFAPIEGWEVLDLLTSLTDKSMVLAEDGDVGTSSETTRYRMLETLRQYADEKRAANDETTELKRRHRDWCLALAEEAEPHFTRPDEAAWLNRLEAEHDNLRAALVFCATEIPLDEGQSGLRLAGALWWFWYVRGYLAEGREHLQRELESARAVPLAMRPPETQSALAKALNAAGALAYFQADYGPARSLYEESLGLRRELGDRKGIAELLGSLGSLAYHQGDYESGRRLHEESLPIRRELGDRSGIAMSLNGLANIAKSLGDLAAARPLYEESLSIRREVGDRRSIADSLNNLSVVAGLQHDFPTAWALQRESLAIQQSLGNKIGMALSLGNMGDLASAQGDLVAARTLSEECLVLFCDLGDRHSIAYTLEGLANVALGDSVFGPAVVLYAAADALRKSIGAPLYPEEQTEQDRKLADARSILGDDVFATAWNEGCALSWRQAADFALGREAVVRIT